MARWTRESERTSEREKENRTEEVVKALGVASAAEPLEPLRRASRVLADGIKTASEQNREHRGSLLLRKLRHVVFRCDPETYRAGGCEIKFIEARESPSIKPTNHSFNRSNKISLQFRTKHRFQSQASVDTINLRLSYENTLWTLVIDIYTKYKNNIIFSIITVVVVVILVIVEVDRTNYFYRYNNYIMYEKLSLKYDYFEDLLYRRYRINIGMFTVLFMRMDFSIVKYCSWSSWDQRHPGKNLKRQPGRHTASYTGIQAFANSSVPEIGCTWSRHPGFEDHCVKITTRSKWLRTMILRPR